MTFPQKVETLSRRLRLRAQMLTCLTHPPEPVFSVCRSLNGATDIQEFPDLRGTTSLEIL